MVKLTDREMDILDCLASGYSLPETAEELGIGHTTVHTHRKNIYIKLKAKNGPNAVYNAFRAGFLKVDN